MLGLEASSYVNLSNTVLVSGKGTPFSALVQIHPSFIDAEDAKALAIPFASFTSMHEDNDEIKSFHAAVKKNSAISNTFEWKHYPENHHGFAGARANLDDPSNLASYKDVYSRTSKFFLQHLA